MGEGGAQPRKPPTCGTLLPPPPLSCGPLLPPPSLLRTCAHALKPATAATVPALQALQAVEPGSDTVPGRHCWHVPLPAVAVGAG